MNLVNEFVLGAPRPAVWAGLTNPEIAVPCMPGATLEERLQDLGFRASVTLKVGPVRLQFKGEGSLINLASDGSYGELIAKGSDDKGRGGFKAEMRFTLSENGPQSTRVRVETLLSLTGSVAQYGRGVGIVKEVAGQLTQDFTRNLEARVLALQPSESTVSASAAAASIDREPSGLAPMTPEPSGLAATDSGALNLGSLLWRSLLRWLRSVFVSRPNQP